MDRLTREERSRLMGRIRSRGTKPEMRVAAALRFLSVKFRRHPKLPGHPDFKLAEYHVVLFVHGCFWHRHRGCPRTRIPKSRIAFWTEKFRDNMARDRRSAVALRRLHYSVVVVWECETEKQERLLERLRRVLLGAGVVIDETCSRLDRTAKTAHAPARTKLDKPK